MAATLASKAAMTIQRSPDGGKGWHAIAGKLTVATAMNLDTLVSMVTERHGGVFALINTAHISRPADTEARYPIEHNMARHRPAKASAKKTGNSGTRRGKRA